MNIAIKLVLLAFTFFAPSLAAYSSPMEMDSDGNIVVAKNSVTKNGIQCGQQSLNVIFNKGMSASKSMSADYIFSPNGKPVFFNITKDFTRHLTDEHDALGMKLKCLPSENKIGVFVPPSVNGEDLYLIVLLGGQVIDGYDLTGHDQDAVDK